MKKNNLSHLTHDAHSLPLDFSKNRKIERIMDNLDTNRPLDILILDDLKIVGNALTRQFLLMGQNAASVTTPEDALIFLEENPVDLIVSDLILKGDESGANFLKEVKTKYPRVKRVLMSAFVTRQDLSQAAMQDTCDAFFKKPWTFATLQELLVLFHEA